MMKEPSSLRAEHYLAPETLAQLAPFQLRAKMIVEGIMNGMHRSPYQGLAVEFSEHRQYVAGDETRHLDWKVYGRTDKLYLKQYQQETNLDVVLLVDASGSMRYGSLRTKKGWGGTKASSGESVWTKYDHATATSAALAHLCLQQRDRIGVSTFTNGLGGQVKRSNKREQWRSVLRTLSAEAVDDSSNLVKVADQVLSTVTNRALFFIVSDFLCDQTEIKECLARFKHRRHDVILVQVLDREEIEFNLDESAPFEGLEGEGKINVDPQSIRSSYLEILSEHIKQVRDTARSFGYEVEILNSHKSVGPPLARLFARRMSFSQKSGGR
jgi:uncharacterized protein (DUF58 family)